MAFTLETGTGIAGANAYLSVAAADLYFTDRGVAAWTGSNTLKEQAIIKATDYVELRFSAAWKGEQLTTTQGLSWPRVDTSGFDNQVPTRLQKAVAEYALRALSATLAPDPVVSDTGFSVVTTKEVVGPIEQSYEIAGGSNKSQPMLIRPYPAADLLIGPLLKYTNSVIR